MSKIIVFGGSGGLGKLVAPLLQEKYGNVLLLSSSDVDITNAHDVSDFFDKADGFDVVINLSGFNYDSMLHKIFEKKDTIDGINRVVDVNVRGTINILAGCLPAMRIKKEGRIILFSSVVADNPLFGTGVYSGVKAFIEHISTACAKENAKHGVTCNAIQLGYFDGGMLHRIPSAVQGMIKETVPMKRWGTIEELFSTINYIIDTPYLTGAVIPINGGI